MTLYSLPAGTIVSIARDPARRWFAHTTRIPVEAPEVRTATVHGSSGAVILQFAGFLILSRKNTANPAPSS